MRTSKKRYWGFGLIEVLVTLGVLSVGILGVTVLHSTVTKQSTENKARAEALAIAQSRIEDMRNYTGEVSSLTEFNTTFANTSSFGNSYSVTGTNAVFTRSEQITTSGDLKALTVRVSWTDSDNVSQSVDLSTRLSYVAPRSLGDSAMEAAASVVDAPTGRAILGEGTLPDDLEDGDLSSNSDGTEEFTDEDNRMLVSGDQIVLTLVGACQTDDGSCTEFVRIKGRIYIDQESQDIDPGKVHVIASDAAYCARYFVEDGETEGTPVTNNTTEALMTDTGDYEFFDYTCYIGGGWHGNIGLLFDGGLGNQDKICIGDPVTDDASRMPVIASRRVYRGMLFKEDPSSSTYVWSDDATTKIYVQSYTSSDGSAQARFYSQGIADGVVLGTRVAGDPGHDFVIGSFQAQKTDGQDCIDEDVLMRPDSNEDGELGDLFANMPTDFVCLNDDLLDAYDEDEYGNVSNCPYDPSDPPSTSHVVSGALSFDADNTDENDVIADTIAIQTSDGDGNCGTLGPTHDGTYYQFTYSCFVYDWGLGIGWNGYIEADYDASEMECDPYRITKSTLTADSANNNFTNCNTGQFAVISGTINASGSRKLSTATMGTNGACTVAANGLSFECITNEYTSSTMTFSITFTANTGVVCRPSAPHSISYTKTYTNQIPGNVTPFVLKIASNGNGC